MSVVNCKVKYIRPKYNNLKEWFDDYENNYYIGSAGIVFINKERFPKKTSLFHNPFKIDKDNTREDVIKKYKKYIKQKIKNDNKFKNELLNLKNKNLGCWCHPEPCHGDVLLKIIKKIVT